MGVIECVTFRLFSFEKEVSAYAETLIKSDLNFCIVQIQVYWALPRPVLAGSRAATCLLPMREDVVSHCVKSCPGAQRPAYCLLTSFRPLRFVNHDVLVMKASKRCRLEQSQKSEIFPKVLFRNKTPSKHTVVCFQDQDDCMN